MGQSASSSRKQTRPNEPPDQDDLSAEISREEAFTVLRNHRRRAVLHYLFENDGEASIRDITEHVATEEYDIDADGLSLDQHKRVYTALYQSHLPRLDELDVVEFEKESGTVALGDGAPTVERYLSRGETSRSAPVEFAVASVVVPLVTLGIFDLGPFGDVPLLLWAGLTVLCLFGLGLVELVDPGRISHF